MPVLLTNINLYSYLYSLCICVYLWWIGGGLTINLELPARLKPIWQTTPCAGWPGPPRCTLPPTTWRALPSLCSITWPASVVGMEWIGVHWTKCIVHSVQLYNTQCTLQYIVPPDTCTLKSISTANWPSASGQAHLSTRCKEQPLSINCVKIAHSKLCTLGCSHWTVYKSKKSSKVPKWTSEKFWGFCPLPCIVHYPFLNHTPVNLCMVITITILVM